MSVTAPQSNETPAAPPAESVFHPSAWTWRWHLIGAAAAGAVALGRGALAGPEGWIFQVAAAVALILGVLTVVNWQRSLRPAVTVDGVALTVYGTPAQPGHGTRETRIPLSEIAELRAGPVGGRTPLHRPGAHGLILSLADGNRVALNTALLDASPAELVSALAARGVPFSSGPAASPPPG